MTLTLSHDEAYEYMDMKQHVADLNNYINHLQKALGVANEYIAKLGEENQVTDSVYEEVVEDKSGTHWTTEEKEILSNIRNKNGTYNGMHIDTIMSFFPGRSRSSVVSALWTKNIGVKKDRLVFKLPKVKE